MVTHYIDVQGRVACGRNNHDLSGTSSNQRVTCKACRATEAFRCDTTSVDQTTTDNAQALAELSLTVFVRQVTSRSYDHRRAMGLLASAGIPSQMVAVLRQELDSMVRVIYLLEQDLRRRELLIEAAVSGQQWLQPNGRGRVTDREMVDLAQKLQGWTRSVYKFGCAFIHLSSLHDYNDRDPLGQLPGEERQDILEHCRHYHGGPNVTQASFSDLLPYLPAVLDKVSGNLECYLEQLQEEGMDT